MSSWRVADFKGKKVWVEVGADGQLAASGGRVAMRYSAADGAKLYRAAAANVVVDVTAPVQALGAGVEADAAAAPAAKASRGSGFGKAGTRTKAQAVAAHASAAELVASRGESVSVAYTDGGCKGNPGPAGSGARLELRDGRVAEWSRGLGIGTNNVAELTAIEMVLDLLDEAALPPRFEVMLLTDSSYAHGVLCKGWKAKANAALIEGIRSRLAARPGVQIHWVAGHVGLSGNERADALANDGVADRSVKRWDPAV